MPLVSFIVPIYNVEQYLDRCLWSIENQTIRDWEAVLVNDASTDSSFSIAAGFADRDGRFKLIDRPHGGLSATRNAGLEAASGEFIIYIDSDDFIHPQLLEIVLNIQERSKADIVTWYKDRYYRFQQKLARSLGKDYINLLPHSFKRQYTASKTAYYLTDDLIAFCTEDARNKLKHAVYHNYAWRSLIRADIAKKVKFIEGITFEDFPWWSEILLHRPLAAITDLPLYYYRWNPGSIDNSSARSGKFRNWMRGLDHTWALYCSQADSHQMECWSRNIKWPVIYYQLAKHSRDISKDYEHFDEVIALLKKADDSGVFDDALGKIDKWSAKKLRELYNI